MAYKVKKGDTLSAIAKANQTTVKAIQAANPKITNPNLIKPGQVFNIPGKAATVPTGPTGATGPTGSTGPTGATGATLTDAQILENERAYQRQQDAIIEAEKKRRAGQSAYDLLLAEFNRYGLGTLLDDVKDLIVTGADEASLTLALRQTKAYQARFAANQTRINSGLRALSEAEYVTLEDQYQNVMRNYGLPATYYTKDATGKQAGFEKFIAGDVSASELEDRISIAQKRVIDAAPQVKEALKQFYPDIKDGDILAYTLDPTQGLANIQKKVLAAEIGGAAIGAGLGYKGDTPEAIRSRAEELARYGVTAETAKAGFGAIGGGLERGRQLSSIYQQPDYNQAVAEEEIFNLPGQTQAGEKRKKIIGLEKATFGGQTGVSSGALSQNRAGSY
jgi:LysM repeat protein